MKFKIILYIFLFSFFISVGQISVSSSTAGSLDKFKPEVFKNFKATTTVFILSNVYKKEEYEKLLKTCWTVTPFKIVSVDDFDYRNYLSKEYSFAHLISSSHEEGMIRFTNRIKFYMIDLDKVNKKIESTKEKYQKFIDLINYNLIEIASIELFANTEMCQKIDSKYGMMKSIDYSKPSTFIQEYEYFYSKKVFDEKELKFNFRKEMIDLIYEDPSFKNYTLGVLKNYFQKLNGLLVNEQFCGLKETDYKSNELKNLKIKTLYIPDYNNFYYIPARYHIEDVMRTDKQMEELFKDYKYKYEFIKDNDLDSKIQNNDEIYYLRYVKVNNRKYFHIVNSKTGEVIYKDFGAGLSTYNINGKDFKNLSEAIDQ